MIFRTLTFVRLVLCFAHISLNSVTRTLGGDYGN